MSSASIYAYSIGSLTLDCVNTYSCRYMRLYCGDTCTIRCMEDQSCLSADFFINDHDQFGDTYLNLTCNSSLSCSNAEFQCTNGGRSQLLYDVANWRCDGYACCPYRQGDRICAVGQPCKIDCGGESCLGYNIDASLATSLTLNCTGQYACQGTKIICPTVNNAGSCTIQCPDSYSCEYSYVMGGDGNQMNGLYLQCSGYYGCHQMYVEANASTLETVNVNCTEQFACKRLDITAK
eukprot:510639_1